MRNNKDEAKLSDPYCPPLKFYCRDFPNPLTRIFSFFGNIPNSPVTYAGMSEQMRDIIF
jgi:hypothetical protein